MERLGEAGCDDALVGIERPGRLALELTRETADAEAAVRSALADVRRGVPTARLVEVAPDFVGLTDVAEIVGVSRHNMRKLMLAHPGSFPVPEHEGSVSIWHLADVLVWLQGQRELCLAAGDPGGGSSCHAGQCREGAAADNAPAFCGVGSVGRLIGAMRLPVCPATQTVTAGESFATVANQVTPSHWAGGCAGEF